MRFVKAFVPLVPGPHAASAFVSIRQEYVAGSSVVHVNVAVGEVEIDGGAPVRVIVGGVLSSVHVKLPGDASTFPAASIARAWNVCEPSGGVPSDFGAVHTVKAAPSRLHWNVALGSLVNENEAGPPFGFVTADASRVVSGATVSTVHVNVGGVVSVLPAPSLAATLKVCWPSARFETVKGLAQAELVPSRTQVNVAGVFVAENVNWSDV